MSGWTSTHGICSLPKEHLGLVASKFGKYEQSCYRHLCIGVCVGMSSIYLGKYQGAQLRHHLLGVYFVRNRQTVCQGGCTALHSHQQ